MENITRNNFTIFARIGSILEITKNRNPGRATIPDVLKEHVIFKIIGVIYTDIFVEQYNHITSSPPSYWKT